MKSPVTVIKRTEHFTVTGDIFQKVAILVGEFYEENSFICKHEV